LSGPLLDLFPRKGGHPACVEVFGPPLDLREPGVVQRRSIFWFQGGD